MQIHVVQPGDMVSNYRSTWAASKGCPSPWLELVPVGRRGLASRCYYSVKESDKVGRGATERDRVSYTAKCTIGRSDKGIAHVVSDLSNPLCIHR